MELSKRLEKYLKNIKGNPPWSHGFDPGTDGASNRTMATWRVLTPVERLIIRRFNPFRAERVKKIREISAQGLTRDVLSDVSGLSLRAIDYIIKGKVSGWRSD